MKPTSTDTIGHVGRNTLLLLFVAMLLTCGLGNSEAQSALDGCDPNANGTVRAIVVQADGKIVIGGDFTSLAPNGGVSVTRNHIARLNPDGTLDSTFNPNANQSVYSIGLQPDGKILVAGTFTIIDGQARSFIARLDPLTGLADSFNPNANLDVYTIAVQADGKIWAGGLFTSIGGQTRNHIARLDPFTGLADSLDPNANSLVFSLAFQSDGKILVGGVFSGANSIGGQTRNRIARLDPATGLADSFNPNANSAVNTIAVQADGKILVGGGFSGANSIGGQARNRIARLDPATGLADSFNPNATNGAVNVIVVQADGKILAGGSFNGANSIGGQTRNNIARLNPTSGLADSFDPNAVAAVLAIAVQTDDKILAGGNFSTLAPNGGAAVTRNRIVRLEIDGRVDRTLNLGLSGGSAVHAVAIQPDGKILIGGNFTTVLGVTRNSLARLNTDGTLDTAFNPNANDFVEAIAVQADGKILAGGSFTLIGGSPRNRIARLDAATGAADSFAVGLGSSGDVYSIAVQPDGKILVGGAFTNIGGQARNDIARLDAATGAADSFNPNANAFLYSIAVQPDGKILVGGAFTNIGGQARNDIARLDAATGAADSFNPNGNNIVFATVVQTDGRILTGGNFNGANSIGGQTRNRIARLDATTGAADSFDPNANLGVFTIAVQADGRILTGGNFNGANSIGGQTRNRIARLDATTGAADSFDPNANVGVFAIAVQADGKILAGGDFTSIAGQTRSLFARLTNDTIAVQNLDVSQTTVTWTRDGSSPQFTRVTFEDSTDGVNYNSLGNGTATGSNWTLTGLNLSIQQNIYIRARGYYRSGLRNGSESIAESVRNAFIPVSTPTLTPTATPTPGPTPTVTPTPTPTSTPLLISGAISYCSNPGLPPVSAATVTLTGDTSGSTSSDGAGNYTLSSIPSGGNYTVTPTKTPLAPGSAGINTVDVLAIQRHFLNLGTPLAGCRLTAANVNGDAGVTTIDVVATQRFFLGFLTGTANVGKYQFRPANRSYTGAVTNQTAQNYDTLVFGDVASAFVH